MRIAQDLELPLESVTETFGVLGKRGSGKTHTASVLAEEMLAAGLQTVVIDPLDAWWGLRSSADGQQEGLPIYVFGGDHADLPLESGSGSLIADGVVERGVSVILSLRHLSKGRQRELVAAFAERLYHRKGELQHRTPVHVFVDEADAFVPQRVMADVARVHGAIDDLVRRGRSSGIGVTLITQRPAVISKDVLTQIECLVALRTVSPQDRKALEAWIEAHDAHDQREEFMTSLAGLPIGTAWFWSAGWLDLFQKVQVRARYTFDSSATPKFGERPVEPARLAPVDLDQLRAQMEAAIQQAQENDPRHLRRRIAELERELRKAQAERPAPEVRTVEVPVLDEGLADRLEHVVADLNRAVEQLREPAGQMWQAVHSLRSPESLDPSRARWERLTRSEAPPPAREAISSPAHDEVTSPTPYARGLLESMAAHHPVRLTRAQISTLSGRRPRSSAFAAAMAEIVRGGWARQVGDQYELTEEGLDLVGGSVPPARDPREVWLSALPAYERSLLEVLIEAYPEWVTREELAERTGRSLTSSAFGGAISTLRRNGLVDVDDGRVRASDTLFMTGGE